MEGATACMWDTTAKPSQCKNHYIFYEGERCAIKHATDFTIREETGKLGKRKGYLAIMACTNSGYLVKLDKKYKFEGPPIPCRELKTDFLDENVDRPDGTTTKRFPELGPAIKACKINGSLREFQKNLESELAKTQ